ncbi:MAG: GNAT family N-acetyltransferase [Gammaproteobacteria bacterium]|nr:GNAT family N-acetyltransferase [Gammaproteobacteria bacterium]
MWRDSKERALGIKEIHTFDDHLYFLKEILSKDNTIYLAILDHTDQVIGLVATDGMFINQLYIHIEFQRLGIGSKLLQLAKEISVGKLRLYTFQVNLGAQAFYEQHGFSVVGVGCDSEEQLPDILYEWNNFDPDTTSQAHAD